MTAGMTKAMAEGRDELTQAEAEEYLEGETHRYFGIDVAEFIRRAEAGELPEHPVVAHLVLLTGARSDSC